MSDYFSLPPRGGGTSTAGTPGDDGSNSERSSQYMMDPGNGAESIQSSASSPPVSHTDHILPKDDPKSPYHVYVPVPNGMSADIVAGGPTSDDVHDGKYVREYPTDILVDRFKKWRKILKGIGNYLREVAYAQEQFARINFQLKGSVKFPFLTDLEEGTNKVVDPFDRKGAVKRQQPLTLAQQREQQQMQQQQEMLQQLQQQQQQQQMENFKRSQRDFSDDHGLEDDFQAVRTDRSTAAPSGFLAFGSGSVQDIQVVLKKYHLSLAAQQLKTSKEITQNMLPRIEDLRKDLHLKIKEIKELSGDFKTNINEHVAITGQLLNRYIASIKYMTTSTTEGDHIKLNKKGTQLKPKHDPYLLKLQLDLQLKRQLLEENYLQEAYINLQTSGMELEKIVYGKIQQFLQKYSAMMDAEAKLLIKNLCRELQQGILSKPPAFEWDKFVGHHPACLLNWKSTDPFPPSRKLSDIVYPQMKSAMAKCIRAGYLSKKSKYLKNYNRGYFVLTSNYLHEFKSSNFFNSTVAAQGSKEVQNTSLSARQTAKASLMPLMSIPLNDCILTEASDEKFVLVGKPTFNGLETRKANPTPLASSAHPSHLNEAPAQLTKHTKHTIGKLLKGGKGKISSAPPPPKPAEYDEIMTLYTATQQDPNKTISWSFKPASSNTSEDDIKLFRKWAHDLKNLTSFHNTRERSKFIEDRMVKANYRNSRYMLKHTNSTQSMATTLDNSSLRNDLSSMRLSRPQHIQLNNAATAPDLSVYRSKCNTPAVDDNGNLITVGERRNLPSNMSMTPPLISPRDSIHSGSSQSVNTMNQQPPFPMAGMTITSNGISPSTTVLDASPLRPSLKQRSTSQQTSTPPSAASGASVRSAHSAGSGGGYFAIPVRNQGDNSQGSTPSFVDAPSGTPQQSLPRPASYTAVPRQYSGAAVQQNTAQRSVDVSSTLPKVRLNDQEIEHPVSASNLAQSGEASDFQLRPPELRKNASAGDIPTVKAELNQGANVASQLYSRNNGSQTSLNTTSSRTHAIRKHKKNVSFSSLNSLMFSKKSANSNGNHTTDQFMSGGIREDDDDEDSQTIKLHKSIYS